MYFHNAIEVDVGISIIPVAKVESGGNKMMIRRCLAVPLVMLAFAGCHGPAFNLPPAEYLRAPGPGVDGPGPGVLSAADYSGWNNPGMTPSGMDPAFADPGLADASAFECPMPTVQVMFSSPAGMHVSWDTSGSGGFDGSPLVVPARTNFDQAGLYRCRLTNIPGHEGTELYPTVEIGTPTPNTIAYLSHNTVPVQLTADDFNQITAGNFVTKVIYLPDPEFQHLAVAGVETLVSTRLDPGVDPVVEADRRGSIMAIVRIGNKDMEMPGTQFCEVYSATLNSRGEVAPVSYVTSGGTAAQSGSGCMAGCCGPPKAPSPAAIGAAPPNAPFFQMGNPGFASQGGANVAASSMQAPIYGMPITGTPIGLPGPPHIPLGAPAGLKKHIIANHTHTYIPDPSHQVKIHVKQHPPVSYPAPRTRAWINQYDHPNCGHHVRSGY